MKTKLVRDGIKARAALERVHAANSPAGKMLGLYLKLNEEADEIADDPCNPEEYADLLEVIAELMRMNRVDGPEVERVMREKRARLGAFALGRILIAYDSDAELRLREYGEGDGIPD